MKQVKLAYEYIHKSNYCSFPVEDVEHGIKMLSLPSEGDLETFLTTNDYQIRQMGDMQVVISEKLDSVIGLVMEN